MIDEEAIDHLAALARLAVPPAERAVLQKDLAAILDYISELKEAGASASVAGSDLGAVLRSDLATTHNIWREDNNPCPGGEYREKLLAAAPHTAGGYFQVKKVLDNK